MANTTETYPFAAAVYTPHTEDRDAIAKFVDLLKREQVCVGGVLQEPLRDSERNIVGLDTVDIATGQRIPLSRPTGAGDSCGLDINALTDSTGIIRAAIRDQVDLVVVEKFGEHEQNGEGLNDEILESIAEGLPLLISVSEAALPIWQQRTGELGEVLPFEVSAFREWWGSISSTA